MKYERNWGGIFPCRKCKKIGMWRWWWNRRNGKFFHVVRYCGECGRKSGYKMLRDINSINHGCKLRRK